MKELLSQVNSPEDIKGFNYEQLENLAQEIRDEIIINLSETGGHLASSLGVVELTLALHTVLDSPQDKIVWDVGHQSYAHKMITGRKEEFKTLRQLDGLSGFPKRSESEHDHLNVGHSSTSISAALGMASARDLQGQDQTIAAVIGDGALTAGMSFEALNHAGHSGKDLLVVLNDNEMSISENVGAMSNYLSKIRSNPYLHQVEKDVGKILNKIPAFGNQITKTAARLKNSLKFLVIPGILFEEMGFTYLGPIDGHNVKATIETIENAKNIEGPVLLHTITTKGKGYKIAEDNPSKYHGVSPFNIRTGKKKKTRDKPTYTNIYSQQLTELAKEDEGIVAISAAMEKVVGDFKDEFPDRFYDVGIAEQHAVTFASGLALQGMKPFVTIYSTFLQRAYDQLVHDVCLQKAPVKLALDRAGIVGKDGETHQGVMDFSYLRHMPNMTVMAPKDENELKAMVKTAAEYDEGPIAFRYPRGEIIGVEEEGRVDTLEIGTAELLREGKDGLILAVGSMVPRALQAAQELADAGIDLTIVNSRFVKPLDEELITKLVKEHDYLFTAEEHLLQGGFGSAVAELIVDNNLDINVKRIALPDKFIEHGSQDDLLARYGLDVDGIKKQVKAVISNQ
ncbi:1-deoxy-D-xylulose-5-phosphate synthase [Halanaerobacter jeridensis]|uniref:1-deoxy-D-xylulose-5-phosphate synthase n=1 Tax=Halanaerobacter jeridensis TaxID=706427 RepID=A0A938XTG6_9FIRM|nr:1-deoxy-D-xylulose-5-phosphate synthase [Halanaerobacter jeridensis]MBM7555242.1 1-deoxy-D-xylulose-5-phosphate synthase [Halanaerobacter jeridensis]